MRQEDLLHWVRLAPFVPFRIRMNSGRTFDIRHPELIKVGRSSAVVFTIEGSASDTFEKFEMISLVLIEHVEPLEARQPA